MTGQRFSPEELSQRLSELIRYEMESMPTAALGRIKHLDESERRAEIETVPDGATETNVPIASPFAGDGVGDLTPLDPAKRDEPVYGVVLYTHHPMDEQLASHGSTLDGERDHEEENSIFMPAQIWFDDDAVPEHDGTERRIDHPDNGFLQLDQSSVQLLDSLGAGIEIEASPDPDIPEGPKDETATVDDPIEEWGEEWVKEHLWPDNTKWPIDEDAEDDSVAARLRHPEGPGVTAVDRGVAIEGDRRVTAGRLNDGERKPLAGKFQHFHLIDHGDGTQSLAGPQLSFREFIAWMTNEERQSRLRNAEQYVDARRYAQSYLDWLEEEVGREIDPTNPDDWPDPEPMPANMEHDEWLSILPTEITVDPAPVTASTGGVDIVSVTASNGYAGPEPVAATTVMGGVSVTAGTVAAATPSAGAASALTAAPTPVVDASAAPQLWVDDFTHNALTDHYPDWYDSESNEWEITTAWGDVSETGLRHTGYDGTYSQVMSFDPDTDSAYGYSNQSSSLPNYPQPGDTIHARFRVTVSNYGYYNGDTQVPRFTFGRAGTSDCIRVGIHMHLNGAPAFLRDGYNDNATIDKQDAATIEAPATLEWVIDWGTDDTVVADLYNRSASEHLVQLSGDVPSPNAHSIGFGDTNEAEYPALWDAVWIE